MADVGTARGPYAKSARVRERILDASLEAFAVSGFRVSTMKSIAIAADISERGITRHFPTKESLLLALLERREQDSSALVSDARSLALGEFIEVVRRNINTPWMVGLETTLLAEAYSDEHPAHDHFATRFTNLMTFLSAVFSAVADAGLLAPSVSPPDAATMFIALMDGLQLRWLYGPDAVDVPGTLERFLSIVCPGFDLQSEFPIAGGILS